MCRVTRTKASTDRSGPAIGTSAGNSDDPLCAVGVPTVQCFCGRRVHPCGSCDHRETRESELRVGSLQSTVSECVSRISIRSGATALADEKSQRSCLSGRRVQSQTVRAFLASPRRFHNLPGDNHSPTPSVSPSERATSTTTSAQQSTKRLGTTLNSPEARSRSRH